MQCQVVHIKEKNVFHYSTNIFPAYFHVRDVIFKCYGCYDFADLGLDAQLKWSVKVSLEKVFYVLL